MALARWCGRLRATASLLAATTCAGYLHEMTDGFVARKIIGDWLGFTTASGPIQPLTIEHLVRLIGAADKKKWQHDQKQEYTLT